MRYIKVVGRKLKFRQFKLIHKAINVDFKKFIAVKILKQLTRKLKQKE
jgi:hypothetical protein